VSQRQDGKAPRASSDISPRMLLITAGASALAALITSQVWSNGTILTATLTPVFVAVFKEGMRRPTDKVAAALRTSGRPTAPPQPPRRRDRPVRAASTPVEEVEAHRLPDSEHEGPGDWTEITLRHENGESAEPPPPPQESAPPPEEPPSPPAERGGFRFRMTPRAWKIALITGLLGFVIAAAVITLPELLFGKSLGGGTTLTYFPNTSVSRSSDNTTSKTTATDKTDTSATDTTPTDTTPTDTTATDTTPTDTTGTDTTGTDTTTTDQNAQPQLAPPAGATDTTGTAGTNTTGTAGSGPSSP
jgi:hypothetical protein